jgi:hypothetical protein
LSRTIDQKYESFTLRFNVNKINDLARIIG